MSRIKPKMCAACGVVLDRAGDDEWIHIGELANVSDHIAVPVDYDEVPVRVMCDFCYVETPRNKLSVVPAESFKVPIVGTMSEGSWAACEECAQIAQSRDWSGMVARVAVAKASRGEDVSPVVTQWLALLYAELDKHITGDVRPWKAGDEEVEA